MRLHAVDCLRGGRHVWGGAWDSSEVADRIGAASFAGHMGTRAVGT